MATRPRIGILDDWNGFAASSPLLEPLRAAGAVVVYRDVPDRLTLRERLAGLDVAILWRERSAITDDVLTDNSKLRLIAQTGAPGAGLNLDALRTRGIALAAAPKSPGKSPTAEFTIAVMLSLAHAVSRTDRSMREGRWEPVTTLGVDGRVLGVLGNGRVGSQVAALGAALGMEVRVWSRSLTPGRQLARNVTAQSIDEVLGGSDYVTVQLRLTPETRHFLDHERLRMMKRGAFLINTARAGLVDVPALLGLLDSGVLAGAALDVFDNEPLPATDPLRSHDKVFLTPHLGWTSQAVQQRLLAEAVDNVLAFLAGRPQHLVLPPQPRTAERR